MNLPKIMNASFEESLTLLDDGFVKYMIKDVEQPGIREKPVLLKILAIVIISILFGISVFVTNGVKVKYSDSPVPQPKINFLPIELFLIFFSVYILIWIYTLCKRSKNTKFFFGYINTTNILRWLAIEVNLFFLTFCLIPLTIFGVIFFIIVIGCIDYAIIKSKLKSLNRQLFVTEIPNEKLDDLLQKIMKFLMKYGWLAVIGVALWKFIFPNTTGVRTDIVGFIGIIFMIFIMNIGLVVMEMYLFLPYLLYGYYKYKYPEDYRKWENKTQLEWYGEKYFNKHIRGTELEEKTNV